MHGVHERFSIRRDGGGQNYVSPNIQCSFRQACAASCCCKKKKMAPEPRAGGAERRKVGWRGVARARGLVKQPAVSY